MNDLPRFHKTRIAPTPSGYLHLGNALSFVLTHRLAQRTGAKILLRIDDMDQQRINPNYLQDIFDTLHFLNIDWDEGPRDVADHLANWSQLKRMDRYNDALQQLEDDREVFACRCSRAQLQDGVYPGNCRNRSLPLDTPETACRLYTDERRLSLRTLNEGIITTPLPPEMRDLIVRKKDGYPAYQLSSMVDDVHFGIDLVVRGADLYPSTLGQLYLADVLGQDQFQNITFHHHPLVTQADGAKLSKSAGATSIRHLRQQGKTVEEVYAEIDKLLLLNKLTPGLGKSPFCFAGVPSAKADGN